MKSITLLSILVLSIFTSACGGGSSTNSDNDLEKRTTNENTEADASEKIIIYQDPLSGSPDIVAKSDDKLIAILANKTKENAFLNLDAVIFEDPEKGIISLQFGSNGLPTLLQANGKKVQFLQFIINEESTEATVKIISEQTEKFETVKFNKTIHDFIDSISLPPTQAQQQGETTFGLEAPQGSTRDSIAKILSNAVVAIQIFSCATFDPVACVQAPESLIELEKNDGVFVNGDDSDAIQTCIFNSSGKLGSKSCIIENILKSAARSLKYDEYVGSRYVERLENLNYENAIRRPDCDCPGFTPKPSIQIESPRRTLLLKDQIQSSGLEVSLAYQGNFYEATYNILSLDVSPFNLSGNLYIDSAQPGHFRTLISGDHFHEGTYIMDIEARLESGGTLSRRALFSVQENFDVDISDSKGTKILEFPKFIAIDSEGTHPHSQKVIEKIRDPDDYWNSFLIVEENNEWQTPNRSFYIRLEEYIENVNGYNDEKPSQGFVPFPDIIYMCKDEADWIPKKVVRSFKGYDDRNIAFFDMIAYLELFKDGTLIYSYSYSSDSSQGIYEYTISFSMNLNTNELGINYSSVFNAHKEPDGVGTIYEKNEGYHDITSSNAESKIKELYAGSFGETIPQTCY